MMPKIPSIVTANLVMNLDASNPSSYSGSGVNWFDISGSSNNGLLVNSPTFNSANGGSIVFDGTDDYVSTSLLATKLEFTIFMWVKLNQTLNNDVLCVDDGSGYLYLGFADSTNKIYMGAFDSSPKNTQSTNVINTNQIYNFVGTYKANETVKLYINGFLDSQSATTLAATGIGLNVSPLKFFKNGSSYSNGNIYQTLLYSRALTASEILQNFNATKSKFGLW